MHVILVAPHFPSNQRRFVRGLKNVGARVTGIGDAPASVLDAETRSMLDGYEQVPHRGRAAHSAPGPLGSPPGGHRRGAHVLRR